MKNHALSTRLAIARENRTARGRAARAPHRAAMVLGSVTQLLISVLGGALCVAAWIAYAIPIRDIPGSPYDDDLTICQVIFPGP
jgi:hypothetical protein